MQQLQALCAQLLALRRKAGHVAAGMGEAGHQPVFDRVLAVTITIGIVDVASINNRTDAIPPGLTMTSGFCRTNSGTDWVNSAKVGDWPEYER